MNPLSLLAKLVIVLLIAAIWPPLGTCGGGHGMIVPMNRVVGL
jgi:hypothetical protein